MASILVAHCPRCGAQNMTFEVYADIEVGSRYGWARVYEMFAMCRSCHRSTVFQGVQQEPDTGGSPLAKKRPTQIDGALTGIIKEEGYLSLVDQARAAPPDYCPEGVQAAFKEAATCLRVKCPNAAAAMFRLVIDLVTGPMLPPPGDAAGPDSKTRRDLGLRLPWLFDKGILPDALRELASCVRQDGNEGAHAGTLSMVDAEDLLDFTTILLERVFSEPERVKINKPRREERRTKPTIPLRRDRFEAQRVFDVFGVPLTVSL